MTQNSLVIHPSDRLALFCFSSGAIFFAGLMGIFLFVCFLLVGLVFFFGGREVFWRVFFQEKAVLVLTFCSASQKFFFGIYSR